MDELVDSAGLVRDRDALRVRLAADGYLFFRGLLPAREMTAAGAAVTSRLQGGGWLSRGGTPDARPRAVNPADALADPAFRAALASTEFNRIPYLPALRTLVRRVLGDAAFSYPAKVLRAVYPEVPGRHPRGRYVHYDYAVAGVQDMLTSWVPLIDIPAQLGGLAVQPGGHLGRLQPPRVLSRKERGWASTDYRTGDVIIFHSLTPHAARPNDAKTLRLSGDFRWQLPDQPVPAELVLAPGGQPWEMFSRLFRFRRWWEPVPAGLELYPKNELVVAPPGPSRFFPVHPSWRHWRPPPGTVH